MTKSGQSEEERENTKDEFIVEREETPGPHKAVRSTEEIRQGHTGDHLRYILRISLVAIVILFAVLYLLYWR